MLSRVAESLYWMARYIERAEDLTRLLAVNFNALLDSQSSDATQGWLSILNVTGDAGLVRELYGEVDAQQAIHFIISFGAGGGADIVGRILADAMQNRLGQPVVREQARRRWNPR